MKLTPIAEAAGAAPIPKTKRRAPMPPTLADVALIDGPACAAAASISISQWHELVKTGEAPPPAIRSPRCTRWRLADVREWLVKFAQPQPEAARAVMLKARRASKAAHAKRAAAQAGA